MSTKRILLLLLLFLGAQYFLSAQQPPVWSWVRTSGASASTIVDIKADASGNVYVAGNYQGTQIIEGVTLEGANENSFIMKYNQNGEFQWIRNINGTYHSSLQKIALDDEGNVLLAGYFGYYDSVINIGNLSLSTSSPYGSHWDFFIAKMNPSGDTLWAKKGYVSQGAGGIVKCSGLAVDSQGSVYASGTFNAFMTFGNTEIRHEDPMATTSVFVVKYSASGDFAYVMSSKGQNGGIAVDREDNLYVAGNNSSRQTTLGSFNLPDTGMGYVAKFNSVGEGLHIRTCTSGNVPVFIGITTDSQGNVLASGRFTVHFTVNGNRFDAPGATGSRVFIMKYTAEGDLVWSNPVFTESYYLPSEMITDSQDNIILSGMYGYYPLVMGGWTLPVTQPMSSITHPFFFKFDAGGNIKWAKSMDAMLTSNYVVDVALDGLDNIFGSGYCQSTSTFDSLGTTTGGFFVGKLTDADLSVSDVSLNNLSALPNPVIDVLTLSSNIGEVKSVEVYNVLGQKVKTSSGIAVEMNQIDLSDLSSGVYMLNVSSLKASGTIRIIKK